MQQNDLQTQNHDISLTSIICFIGLSGSQRLEPSSGTNFVDVNRMS